MIVRASFVLKYAPFFFSSPMLNVYDYIVTTQALISKWCRYLSLNSSLTHKIEYILYEINRTWIIQLYLPKIETYPGFYFYYLFLLNDQCDLLYLYKFFSQNYISIISMAHECILTSFMSLFSLPPPTRILRTPSPWWRHVREMAFRENVRGT